MAARSAQRCSSICRGSTRSPCGVDTAVTPLFRWRSRCALRMYLGFWWCLWMLWCGVCLLYTSPSPRDSTSS
eukprot:1903978-Prorocentrum_lima.AAC.1